MGSRVYGGLAFRRSVGSGGENGRAPELSAALPMRGALAPGIDTAALSIPRGNGKTSLAAHVVARALTPGDSLYERGREIVLISGSLAQSRFGFKIVRRELESLGLYRWSNSTTGVGQRILKAGWSSES